MKRIIDAFIKRYRGTACAALALCAATAIALPAQVQPDITGINLLDSFNGSNGATSDGGLIQGFNGDLYGTTYSGGTSTYCPEANCGTVFKLAPGGALTTLYNFCSTPVCEDGSKPNAPLALGANGDFYGTTHGDGANGYGTVFEITPGGALTTLYSFCSLPNCADGDNPEAGLVLATNGDLYGTTNQGGNSDGSGCGTVFKITPSGILTTMYTFCANGEQGGPANPGAPLIQATDQDLYGTTQYGGATGNGTVFRITLNGVLTTLYSFCSQTNCSDGRNPESALVQVPGSSRGVLFYGTTANSGASSNLFGGTAFSITGDAALTTIYTFCSLPNCVDGSTPSAGTGILRAANGSLYGTTFFGGEDTGCNGGGGCGTIFEIANGMLTTRASLDNTNGNNPQGGLVQATNGTIYGTTWAGGADNLGTVFSLAGGNPFVKTVPGAGVVGSAVKILGTFPKGATSVSFNGVAATFTNISAYELSAKVPTGATTGTVEVVMPSGTLSSYPPFQVLP
jgi:uncharacterized repeat protein (TIGR03803 family)